MTIEIQVCGATPIPSQNGSYSPWIHDRLEVVLRREGPVRPPGGLEGLPEVVHDGGGEGVLPEVGREAAEEGVGGEDGLQHADDGGALVVGDGAEVGQVGVRELLRERGERK